MYIFQHHMHSLVVQARFFIPDSRITQTTPPQWNEPAKLRPYDHLTITTHGPYGTTTRAAARSPSLLPYP